MGTKIPPGQITPPSADPEVKAPKAQVTPMDVLCHQYDVSNLGEGNLDAGLNLLAAMALTIANAAPFGSGLVTQDKKIYKAGLSFLASGSNISSLVSTDLLDTLYELQNNLEQHLDRTVPQNPSPKAQDNSTSTSSILLDELERSSQFESSNAVSKEFCRALLTTHPSPSIDSLRKQSRVYAAISRPGDLKLHAGKCQSRKLIISQGINESKDFKDSSDLLNSLREGAYTLPGSDRPLQGNYILRDPYQLLEHALKEPDNGHLWLGQTLWLLDHSPGKDLEQPKPINSLSRLTDVPDRYRLAVAAVWAERITESSQNPILHKLDASDAQIRWIQFLKSMENSFPGVTGSFRPLMTSLLFGLYELCRHPNTPNFKIYPPVAESLARHLVHRMINFRSAVQQSTHQTKVNRLKPRIMQRLSTGMQTSRDLYRALGVNAELCHEALDCLVKEDAVICTSNAYCLATGKDETLSTDSPPPINV